MMDIDQLTATIQPVPPFDFELTAGYHTYFQSRYGTDTMEDGVYQRLLDLGDKLVLASVRSAGTTDAPELALELQGSGLTPEDVENFRQSMADSETKADELESAAQSTPEPQPAAEADTPEGGY